LSEHWKSDDVPFPTSLILDDHKAITTPLNCYSNGLKTVIHGPRGVCEGCGHQVMSAKAY